MVMAPGRRGPLLLVAAALVLVTAGCGRIPPALSAEALEQRTVAVLERLPVDALGDGLEATSEQVKLDRPYASAHAVGPDVDLEAMAAAVVEVLEADGLEVLHRQPVDYQLGYEVLAADRRLVARVQLGPGIDGNVTYPPLDRGTYVTIQVANVHSGPAWTEVER
jgi:hypothetical protein